MRPPAENKIADLVVREAPTSRSFLARGPATLPGCWRGVENRREGNEAAGGDFVVREALTSQSSLAHGPAKLPGCWRGVENLQEGNEAVGDFVVREALEIQSSLAHGPAKLPGYWRGGENRWVGNEVMGDFVAREAPESRSFLAHGPAELPGCWRGVEDRLRSMPKESERVVKTTRLLADFELPGCWRGVESHREGNEAAAGGRSEPRHPRLRLMPKESERVAKATRSLADLVVREALTSQSSSARGPAELPGCWLGVENCREGTEAAGGGRSEPHTPRLRSMPKESERVAKAIWSKNNNGANNVSHLIGFDGDNRQTMHQSDQCNDGPSKGIGFKLVAFDGPLCENLIASLNDAVSKVTAEAPSLRVNFLCTPASEKSIHGLVRIAFDGTDETEVERADRLLRRCEAAFKLMRLPIVRYGASTDTPHESSCNVLRSKL